MSIELLQERAAEFYKRRFPDFPTTDDYSTQIFAEFAAELLPDAEQLLMELYGPNCSSTYRDLTSTGLKQISLLLDQYRKALENFGVTFADNGFIRKIPRHDKEAGYRNALTEILTLRSRHAKDCHIVAREALKGAS
jgi:hypothetical protein